MTKGTFVRRDVLEMMAVAGATGLPAVGTLWPGAAHAAGAPAYNPAARFDLAVSEVELRRNGAGRMLMARIYQPKGPGPFPTVLDLHGGAWNRKDRLAEEPMDRALASSGLLVVAVDMTVAPEAPYPACVQDANYAVRWLKANADAAKRFRAVFTRGQKLLTEAPKADRDAFVSKFTSVRPELVAEMSLPIFVSDFNVPSLKANVELAVGQKLMKSIDVDSMIWKG